MFVRSRYKQFWRNIVYRELMLKRGVQKDWKDLPQLDSITLSIRLEDTRLEAHDQVEKHQLFLHRLALEYITGKAADYIPPPNRKVLDKASGVRVTLKSESMYNFLEKLVYVVLPNQMGFEGVQPAVNLAEEAAAIHKRAKRATPAPRIDADLWGADIEVPNMLVFPEFVADFELFEPLQSMRARLVVRNAALGEDAMMVLEAMGLPRAPAAAASQ